jgi:REP element-mobilizing transposase RayT
MASSVWLVGCLSQPVRPKRNFQARGLYAVTQRGNQGQWVYRDVEDFEKALELMRKYAEMHGVAVHGYCLLHNHGHWIFEASTPASISNLMRDMQSRYSFYLNRKYEAMPWVLLAPLHGLEDLSGFSRYLRTGPVNWTPRFYSDDLDEAGFKEFLEYTENNPVRAYLSEEAVSWPWSSAPQHCKKLDPDSLLCIDRWVHIFRRPATIAADWRAYLEERIRGERANAAARRRVGSGAARNRPLGWPSGAPPG